MVEVTEGQGSNNYSSKSLLSQGCMLDSELGIQLELSGGRQRFQPSLRMDFKVLLPIHVQKQLAV